MDAEDNGPFTFGSRSKTTWRSHRSASEGIEVLSPFHRFNARMYSSGRPDAYGNKHKRDAKTKLGDLGDNNTSSIISVILLV